VRRRDELSITLRYQSYNDDRRSSVERHRREVASRVMIECRRTGVSTVLDTHADHRRKVVDGRVVRQMWAHPLGRVFAREDRMLTVLEPSVSFGPSGPMPESAVRRLKRLRGPSILSVHDVKASVGGRVVAETELVDAVPLAHVLEHGRLEPARAIGILRQVARALAEAHRGGFVHGALCTSSVLLGERDGRKDAVWVADFGLGDMSWIDHLRDSAAAPCSPERTLGLPRSPSEDAYLFGCIAFAALTGTPVFEGDTEEVRRRHAIEDAPRAHRTAGGRDVPRAIAMVVATCLAKDPEDRFANGDELEAALCEAQIAAGIVTAWDDLPPPAVEPERARAIELALSVRPSKTESRATDPPEDDGAQGVPRAPVPRDHTPLVETELRSVVRRLDEIGRPEPVRRELDRTEVVAFTPVLASSAVIPSAPSTFESRVTAIAPAPESAPRRSRLGRVMGVTALLVASAAGGWLVLQDREGTSDDAATIATEAGPAVAVAGPAPTDEPAPAEVPPADAVPADTAPSEPGPELAAAPTTGATAAAHAQKANARTTKPRAKTDKKREATDTPPERSVAELVTAAKAANAKGDRKAAEALYAEVVARDPDHLGALDSLGSLRWSRGDYRGAAKVLARAVDESPKNAELRIRLGDAHFKLQQYDKARTQFTKAKELGHAAADRRLERTEAAAGS
jgi:serine/threonine protein kinase/TolA-binding protein